MDVASKRPSLEQVTSDLDLSNLQLLREEHQSQNWEHHVSREKGGLSKRRIAFLTAMFVMTGILVFFAISKPVHRVPTGHEFGDCGRNSVVARANGCVFDHITYVWVRPQCHYLTLLAGYTNLTGLAYFSESSMDENSRISLEEIMTGNYDRAWAPKRFHSLHRAFTVSKVHWALINHLPLDDAAISFEHTEHCQMVLLGEMPECHGGRCSMSKLSAKYTSCGYV